MLAGLSKHCVRECRVCCREGTRVGPGGARTRLLGAVPGEARPGLFTVGAITSDFANDVLRQKNDLDELVPYLGQRDTDLSRRAGRGMKVIGEAELLQAHPRDLLQRTYQILRRLHGEAYHWTPPDVQWPESLGATPMRTFVRAWINRMARLFQVSGWSVRATNTGLAASIWDEGGGRRNACIATVVGRTASAQDLMEVTATDALGLVMSEKGFSDEALTVCRQ